MRDLDLIQHETIKSLQSLGVHTGSECQRQGTGCFCEKPPVSLADLAFLSSIIPAVLPSRHQLGLTSLRQNRLSNISLPISLFWWGQSTGLSPEWHCAGGSWPCRAQSDACLSCTWASLVPPWCVVITQNRTSLEQEAQFRCIHLLEGTDLLLAALGLAGNPEVKSPLPTLVMLLELTNKYILSI